MPPHSADVPLADLRRDGGESEVAAERWLDTIGTSRAFLFLHLNEPRAPQAPPERFSMYSAYDGAIAYSDEIVGRLVHYLKSHQMYDRSTIILLSDHGEGLGDHGQPYHSTDLYNSQIRVPLVIAGPGVKPAHIPETVSLTDLTPTVLELAGFEPPKEIGRASCRERV